MLYLKNVPTRERVLRVVLGLIVTGAALALLDGMWGTVVAVSAAGMAASGLFGFCPMCALVGRRLDRGAKQGK